MIEAKWRQDLHNYIGGTLRGLDAKPIIVGGVADHVHLLAGMKSSKCVADLVREVKKASNAWASDQYSRFGWQDGYGAFSVGYRELPTLTTYIANQETHHRTISSQDELRRLLEEHGVEIDERFFQ
ncbi:MAG: transposase, partial [Fimbriimonadaceae bacterium]